MLFCLLLQAVLKLHSNLLLDLCDFLLFVFAEIVVFWLLCVVTINLSLLYDVCEFRIRRLMKGDMKV